MRALSLILAFFPTIILADDFTLTSRVSDVTLYPQGGKVVRTVPFSAPAGSHQLRLLDVPQGTPMETLRVSVSGAVLGAVALRQDYVPPRGDAESPAIKAARDEVERMEEVVRTKADEAVALRLAKEAADTRIGFLRQLGEGEALNGATAEALRDIARMVGEETLGARQAALMAEAQARVVDRDLKDLQDELNDARQRLDALVPEQQQRNLVVVAVDSDNPIEGVLTITYNVESAGWMPVYDAQLTRGDKASLTLKRGAMIGQATGENWQGVNLTLSTNRPSGQTEPGPIYPELRRIVDPAQPAPMASRKSAESESIGAMLAPMMDRPVVVESMAVASVDLDGLSVTYSYPTPVDLASDADLARITLGTLDLDVEIQAVAVPKRDETAFLMAKFTNTSGEMILPSAATQLFLDGEFVGMISSGQIPSGQEAHLPFGPIDGLRLTRVVTRNEGDVGILTKSNEITEDTRIEVENLTGRAWNMRLIDQVPYSEQDDLVITWQARPMPTTRDVDDQKGVFAWEFDLAAKATSQIDLSHKIQWPQNKELR
jgi:uncharacterized protein (TIGR02231 family)